MQLMRRKLPKLLKQLRQLRQLRQLKLHNLHSKLRPGRTGVWFHTDGLVKVNEPLGLAVFLSWMVFERTSCTERKPGRPKEREIISTCRHLWQANALLGTLCFTWTMTGSPCLVVPKGVMYDLLQTPGPWPLASKIRHYQCLQEMVGSVAHISVTGCTHSTVGGIVRGNFTANGQNHGRPTYKKDTQVKLSWS